MSSLLARKSQPLAAGGRLLRDLSAHELALSWLGHAGVVCHIEKTLVAVDPVLSTRIGPSIAGRTIGLPRLEEAPVDAGSLSEIDVVLITHAHFDHLDKPTLRTMASDQTVIVVPPGCRRLVPPGFRRIAEIEPGQTLQVRGLSIEAIKPKHWGARTAVDYRRGVNSYVVRSNAGSLLFAGDTAHTDAFDAVKRTDVAVFGIGAYEPWDHMHATPEQVWAMFLASQSRYLFPVHHSTFELSDEPIDEPLRRLLVQAGRSRERVVAAAPGEICIVRPA